MGPDGKVFFKNSAIYGTASMIVTHCSYNFYNPSVNVTFLYLWTKLVLYLRAFTLLEQ